MYLKFYRFDQRPFHITPDPDFLFLSPSHKEALGSIIYGIKERKGFVSITGEVGTGKTTIIRSYLDTLDKGCITPIYIFNANMTFRELLQAILAELGVGGHDADEFGLVRSIQEKLIDGYGKGQNFALIIDEAQNMPMETLENLRMLSNLETTKEKLLQIVLVGQPELEVKLEREEIRQLRERLAIRATIHPLTMKESLDYIHHRLSHVTKDTEGVFSESSLKKIVRYSGGLPRKINIICDNALIAGFGYQQKPITKKILDIVISDYEGRSVKSVLMTKRNWSIAGLNFLFLFVLAFFYWNYGGHEKYYHSSNYAAQTKGASGSLEEIELIERDRADLGGDPQEPLGKEEATNYPMEDSIDHRNDQESVVTVDLTEKPHIQKVGKEARVKKRPVSSEKVKRNSKNLFSKKSKNQVFPVFKVVKKGDFLTSLCVEVYGGTNEEIVGWVLKNNPWIKDVNRLSLGDVVVFPKPNPGKINLGKADALF